LKDKADLSISNRREFVIVHRGNVSAIKFVTPGSRRIETSKHVHQRRFAAATGTHDGDVFVAPNLKRHAAQGVNDLFAHDVVLRDVFDIDHDRSGLANVIRAHRVRVSAVAVALWATHASHSEAATGVTSQLPCRSSPDSSWCRRCESSRSASAPRLHP